MSLYLSQQGNGEPLVLLHGWGMNSAVWGGLIPLLADSYTVHSIDLPGHGKSPAVPYQGEGSEVLLEQWLTTLDEVLPEQFYLCGWSLGGMLALAIAQRWPDRVKGVVLLAASPRFVAAAGWPGVPAGVLRDFSQRLATDIEATLRQFLLLQCLDVPGGRKQVKALAEQVLGAGVPGAEGLDQGLVLLEGLDFRLAFASFKGSVLLGAKDQLVPAALAEAMRALSQQARVDIWPQSGHAPHVARPNAVARYIEEALT